MNKKIVSILTGSAVLSLGAVANAANLVIDNFNETEDPTGIEIILTEDSGATITETVVETGLSTDNVIGGERTTSLTVTGCTAAGTTVDECGEVFLNLSGIAPGLILGATNTSIEKYFGSVLYPEVDLTVADILSKYDAIVFDRETGDITSFTELDVVLTFGLSLSGDVSFGAGFLDVDQGPENFPDGVGDRVWALSPTLDPFVGETVETIKLELFGADGQAIDFSGNGLYFREVSVPEPTSIITFGLLGVIGLVSGSGVKLNK